jgi:hypothetical protein
MATKTTSTQDLGLANPQMPSQSVRSHSKDIEFALNYSEIPDWDDIKGAPRFKIGIVVDSCHTKDCYMASVSKPATLCTLASLVILEKPDTKDEDETIREWRMNNRLQKSDTSKIDVRWGQTGFQDLLESDVDAVYIIVPPG